MLEFTYHVSSITYHIGRLAHDEIVIQHQLHGNERLAGDHRVEPVANVIDSFGKERGGRYG